MVTTVVAAIIAISVVLLNQYFNARRYRKEKLIGKIEEIYSVLIDFQHLKISIINEIIDNYPKLSAEPSVTKIGERRVVLSGDDLLKSETKLEQMYKESLSFTSKAYMLSALYFPTLLDEITKLRSSYDDLYMSYIKSESVEEFCKISEEFDRNISLQFFKIFEAIAGIMKKSMH